MKTTTLAAALASLLLTSSSLLAQGVTRDFGDIGVENTRSFQGTPGASNQGTVGFNPIETSNGRPPLAQGPSVPTPNPPLLNQGPGASNLGSTRFDPIGTRPGSSPLVAQGPDLGSSRPGLSAPPIPSQTGPRIQATPTPQTGITRQPRISSDVFRVSPPTSSCGRPAIDFYQPGYDPSCPSQRLRHTAYAVPEVAIGYEVCYINPRNRQIVPSYTRQYTDLNRARYYAERLQDYRFREWQCRGEACRFAGPFNCHERAANYNLPIGYGDVLFNDEVFAGKVVIREISL